MLTYKSAHTHTLTRTHTRTHRYIHTLTLTKLHMLTHTHAHHTANSCLCTMLSLPSMENKELCPPPSPHLAQLPHMPGARTDVAVSSSVAAASPVPASVSRVCRTVSMLQSNNESCHTQMFLMFVLKFKKQPPNFSVSHTHTKQFTHFNATVC